MHKKDLVKIYYCHRGNLHSDKNEALWSYHNNIDTNRLFWYIRTSDWYCFRIKIVAKFLRNAGNEHYQTTCHTLEVHSMHFYRCTVVKTINFTLLSSFIWWKYMATCIVMYQTRYQNKSAFIWVHSCDCPTSLEVVKYMSSVRFHSFVNQSLREWSPPRINILVKSLQMWQLQQGLQNLTFISTLIRGTDI